MSWSYKIKSGTFWISPQSNGRYLLSINNQALGSYHSPQSAADDVYQCATGYDAWDNKGSCLEPTDLSEWNTHAR
ncbi:MAG: hypothetical protein HC939_24290 [Pleurocapsa sp. SU_5_0]|jgi:hypothetical protein|nr:hypothetical protein [Pleurocapsa sp. SU_5_0]NJO99116.1 hypothetical protein [Pleurocapsa sp. CRU_1_2]